MRNGPETCHDGLHVFDWTNDYTVLCHCGARTLGEPLTVDRLREAIDILTKEEQGHA